MLCLCGFELYSRWVPLTGARSFSLGNSGISLTRWTVLLLPLCDQPGLRIPKTISHFPSLAFFSSSSPSSPMPNSCGRKSSCSTWSRIIADISGETTIIIEFSRVRAALVKRGNSWKIKLLPKPVGIIPKTSLPRAKSQTLV